MTPWTEKLPKFEMDSDTPLQSVLVHTSESIRVRFFLDVLMEVSISLIDFNMKNFSGTPQLGDQ